MARTRSALLQGLPVYLRAGDSRELPSSESAFVLYRDAETDFTEADRERLLDHGVSFLYLRMSDQQRFREQTEAHLQELVEDGSAAVSEVSGIIYETSLALITELLTTTEFSSKAKRLATISQAITTLVVNNPGAFSHLFAVSHHDFYTATHMVNVATWMVPLSYSMGITDLDELNSICQAGMLHDIGKIYISEDLLNKKGRLTDDDWHLIRRHPELGCQHLEQYDGISEVVRLVTLQHHERVDGSGYPRGLKSRDIALPARICAVVDAFDAMTAFRPFKSHTKLFSEAMEILERDTPSKFDPDVVAVWLSLLEKTEDPLVTVVAPSVGSEAEVHDRRGSRRKHFQCPARLHRLDRGPDGWFEQPGLQVVTHNLSTSGLGMLSRHPLNVGDAVRIYIDVRAWSREYLDGVCVRCQPYNDGWYDLGMHFERGPQ